MTSEQTKQLIAMIGARLETESPFLTPQPTTYMRDPYRILDFFRDKGILSAEEIDAALLQGQETPQ